jgi:hypothetical protein
LLWTRSLFNENSAKPDTETYNAVTSRSLVAVLDPGLLLQRFEDPRSIASIAGNANCVVDVVL